MSCCFKSWQKEAISDILSRHKIPILVGGTGFYIQSVLYDIDFTEHAEDTSLRNRLEEYARTNGTHALHELLVQADPKAAEEIHENNVKARHPGARIPRTDRREDFCA